MIQYTWKPYKNWTPKKALLVAAKAKTLQHKDTAQNKASLSFNYLWPKQAHDSRKQSIPTMSTNVHQGRQTVPTLPLAFLYDGVTGVKSPLPSTPAMA